MKRSLLSLEWGLLKDVGRERLGGAGIKLPNLVLETLLMHGIPLAAAAVESWIGEGGSEYP